MELLQNRSRFRCLEASGLLNRNRLEQLSTAHNPKHLCQIRDKEAPRGALGIGGPNEANRGLDSPPPAKLKQEASAFEE